MTTYTIALLDDMLIIEDNGLNGKFEDCTIINGLTLADSEPENGEVVYTGPDMGWLEDENGEMFSVAYIAE